jgi:hypothetical protein
MLDKSYLYALLFVTMGILLIVVSVADQASGSSAGRP